MFSRAVNLIAVVVPLFLSAKASAQGLKVAGENRLFALTVELEGSSGDPNSVFIKGFSFRYTPPTKWNMTPRALYYRSIFGSSSFTLTEKDVEVTRNGVGLSSNTEGASGSYVEIKLRNHARSAMKGYYAFGVQLDAFGKPVIEHGVVIFQDKLGRGQYFLHLLTIGRQFFRDPILKCVKALSSG